MELKQLESTVHGALEMALDYMVSFSSGGNGFPGGEVEWYSDGGSSRRLLEHCENIL